MLRFSRMRRGITQVILTWWRGEITAEFGTEYENFSFGPLENIAMMLRRSK